jgi:AcrR family transcriptional regulator
MSRPAVPESEVESGRARPLAPEDRRASIIEAAIPLLIQYGRDVTTRQIAEEAGIAEGTIFRAFGDKETLIRGAIEKFLDPEPLRRGLRAIDPELTLEQKLNDILFQMRARFEGIFGIMAAVGPQFQRPTSSEARLEFPAIIAEVLQPDLDRLNWPPERAAHLIRLVAFASSLPQLNEGTEFTTAELAAFLTNGLAGGSVASPTTSGRDHGTAALASHLLDGIARVRHSSAVRAEKE